MLNGFSVLASPRAVFPKLAEKPSLVSTIILASIWGIERNFNELFKHAVPLSDAKPLLEVFGANVVFGILFGISVIWLASWVFAWSSRRLGGALSASAMRTILAWSGVPKVLTLLGLFGLFAALGQSFLSQDQTSLLKSFPALVGVFVLVQLVCSIWTVVLGVVGLSELSKLSIWKSIGVYALGGVILLVPLFGGVLLWGRFGK